VDVVGRAVESGAEAAYASQAIFSAVEPGFS
jgi:hypothetical protein